MSEEQKEEQKAEQKEEQKQEEKPQAKAPEAAPQAVPKPAATEGEAKKPKLSRLSLKEVDEELKKCQEKMGGFNSHYARFLLARKKVLSGK